MIAASAASQDFLHASFADGTRDHARLTESTAARASAHDLHRDAVVDDVNIRHDELGGWGRQFWHNALGDDLGNIGNGRFDVRDSAIFEIVGFVKAGT